MLSRRFLRAVFIPLALAGMVAGAAGCGDDTKTEEPPPVDTEWKAAFDADDVGWLLSVWGSSGNDVYAAGGSPDAGVLMHYDGEAWSPVEIPDVPLLNWIHGFGPNDITFVGSEGTVLHYDGTKFTEQTTPTDQNLWGVWGATPDNLWAVGGEGREEGQATLLHYDGTSWEEVEVPELEKANVFAFFKVWGTSADDVYVVGQRGAVMHYDGDVWTEALVGASDDLISLWGTGPNNVIAVGGRGNGIVSRWDGKAWTTKSLSPLGGLNGIFMRSPDVAHVVGITGTIAKLDVGKLSVLENVSQKTPLDLHAVFGDASGRLTAVGGSLATVQPPHRGIALTRTLENEE